MLNDNRAGSIWRKWDLHIHSEYSLEERAKLKIRDIFLNAIDKGLEVISITDHTNVDGLDEIWDIWENGTINIGGEDISIKQKISFFPGIELKTDKGKRGVHVVVIFPRYIDKSKVDKKFLEQELLSQIKCTNSDIKSAGQGDYKKGLLEKDVDFEEMSMRVRDLGGVVIAHAGTKDNGIETEIKHDSDTGNEWEILNSLGKRKETLMKDFVDICEVQNWNKNNQAEAEFYLKNFFKPTILCSDSHESISGEKFTWIKGDPIFESLKQIILEPSERVKIQPDPPYTNKSKIYFNSIKISGSKNFIIPDIEIPLNRELVSIIGGRGSGKSALLESIGLLNEEHGKKDLNGKEKIIEYYRKNLDEKDPLPNFKITIGFTDKDGKTSFYDKNLDDYENKNLPFLYIGQEKLSSVATNDKELTKKVCDLIQLDYSELASQHIIDSGREKISDIDIKLAELNDLYDKYEDFNSDYTKFSDWIKIYIERKEEQKKRLSSEKTKKLLEDIVDITNKGVLSSKVVESLENLKSRFDQLELNTLLEDVNKNILDMFQDKILPVPLINLSEQKSAIDSAIEGVLKEKEVFKSKYIEKKKELIRLGLKEDVNVLLDSAQNIQKEIANAKQDQKNEEKIEKEIVKLIQDRNGLYNEIETSLTAQRNLIIAKFNDFKRSRSDSQEEDKRIFDLLISEVDIEGKVVVNESVLCNFILKNCVDGRKIANEEELKSEISGKNKKGEAKEITFERLRKWIENDLDNFIKSDKLNRHGQESLSNYLFTEWPQYLNVKAVVKLNDVPTEKLSIGQRGTLLLKMYLATATEKQIFIIDQPEDNLDNEFISKKLVPLIRDIKKTRQIIISTHNANIVVNGDSEQVIVAKLDRGKDYISGSIENSIINEEIKSILEGGEQAFNNRGYKYYL